MTIASLFSQEVLSKRGTGNGHNIRKWEMMKGQGGRLGSQKRKESNSDVVLSLCVFSAKNPRAIVRLLSHPLYTLFRTQPVVVAVAGSFCSENKRRLSFEYLHEKKYLVMCLFRVSTNREIRK